MAVDVLQNGTQRGPLIGTVVIDPSTNDGINILGDILQRHAVAKTEPPVPNPRSDVLTRGRTDAGCEPNKQTTLSGAYQTRSETVPQEIKLFAYLGTAWLVDVTTNNVRLLRMQLKLTFSKTPF